MLTEKPKARTSEKENANQQDKSGKENKKAEKESNTAEKDSGWKKVEGIKRKKTYRLLVKGQGRERHVNTVIRRKMNRALRDEHVNLKSATSSKEEEWVVMLFMTCPIELQKAAEVFNEHELR